MKLFEPSRAGKKMVRYSFSDISFAKSRMSPFLIPLAPEVAERLQERGRQITEEIRRVHGLIDDEKFQSLLDDDET